MINKNYLSRSLSLVLLLTLVSSFIPVYSVHATGGGQNSKINICHVPPGNPSNAKAKYVNENGWNGHDNHDGDFLYQGPVKNNGKFDNSGGQAHQWCKDNLPNDPEKITLVAKKVVCDHEEDLPNWGDGSFEPITSSTAQDFVGQSNGHCELVDWDFQWAPGSASNPGDNTGAAGGPWTTFSGSVLINEDDLSKIWVREVWSDDYIPFTGVNTDQDVSAELYCESDVLHYDNYDFINNPEAGETYHCVGFNVPVQKPAICEPGVELIVNGSFEEPVVETAQEWDVFDSGTLGLGWLVEWMVTGGEEPTPASLELHSGVLGAAADGEQYAELDGDWQGPGGSNGEAASTLIYQDIPTVPGRDYEVTFSFKPRPGAASNAQNTLGVLWGGLDVVELNSDDTDGDWTNFAYTVPAVSELTTLQFEDRGTPDSLGTFLDNVSLKCLEDCEYHDEVIYSGTDDQVDGGSAVLTTTHANWVATSTEAGWIWSDVQVQNPTEDEVKVFTKTFTLTGNPTADALLSISSDNSFKVLINGNEVASTTNEQNFSSFTDVTVPAGYLNNGSNNIEITVHNWAQAGGTYESNPAGVIYALYVNTKKCGSDDNGGGGDPEPEIPTLSLSKSGEYDEELGKITFTIHYEINGAGTAENVVITDSIPDDTTYVPDSATNGGSEAGGTITWNLGDLGSGAAGDISFMVTVDGIGSMWAYEVVDFEQGDRKDDTDVVIERSDEDMALGEAQDDDTINFVSLGFGGQIILEFEEAFVDGSGVDVKIFETSFGSPSFANYPEAAEVYASQDGVSWTLLGTAEQGSVEEFELGALDWAKFIKLVDVSNVDSNKFPNDADGFDLDAVKVMYPQPDVCEVENTAYLNTDNAGGEDAETTVAVNGEPCLPPPPADVCPDDFGVQTSQDECSVPNNPSPTYQCNDGLDNDDDGQIDSDDKGCDSPTDDDETDEVVIVQNNNPDNGGDTGGGNIISFTPLSFGSVLGAATGLDGIPASCPIYLNEFIKLGARNNSDEVVKLQTFLNEYINANLPTTGFYGPLTYAAVKQFQLLHSGNVLKPWVEVGLHNNENIPTGYVYKTTRRWINLIKCPELNIPLPDLSQG